MCGVEGVRDDGSDTEPVSGGVCARVLSLVLTRDEVGKECSVDDCVGAFWGTECSKISDRKRFENVRFASSAIELLVLPKFS